MVPVNTFRNLWQYIASVVGINHYLVVHEDSDLASTIRDIDGNDTLLIAVIPSSDMDATSVDDVEEIDSCFVFIVMKTDRGSLTDEQFLDALNSTQSLMTSVKRKIIELSADFDHGTPYSHMLHGLILPSIHTDPEYNLYGCNGWGISFKLKTKGVSNY